MTMTENPPDWHWGALRSAVAEARWERAWQLVAAWPVDVESQDQAQRYLLRRAGEDDPDMLISSAWLLEHYKGLPVPLGRAPAQSERRDRADGAGSQPWAGQTNRHVLNGPPRMFVTRSGSRLALSATLSLSPFGRPRVLLHANKPSRTETGALDLNEDALTPEHGYVFGGPGYRGDGVIRGTVLLASGEDEVAHLAGLMVRMGQELRNLHEGTFDLVWDADILDQLRAGGPSRHPGLRFVRGGEEARTALGPESLVSAQVLRRRWLSGRTPALTDARQSALSITRSYYPTLITRNLMDQTRAFFQQAGYDASCWDGIDALNLTEDQVRDRAGAGASPSAIERQLAFVRLCGTIRSQLLELQRDFHRRGAMGPLGTEEQQAYNEDVLQELIEEVYPEGFQEEE